MKKIGLGILIGVSVLVLSGIVVAQGAMMRYPTEVLPSGVEVEVPMEARERSPAFLRIMAPGISFFDKNLYQLKGCKIVHELNDATALNCPAGIQIGGAFEDTVLHIMDMEANFQINADDVWALGYTGSGVTVAVLDTGIDKDHPELKSSIVGGKGFGYPDFEDDHGHGTHVSGIITADGVGGTPLGFAKGVAPNTGVWMAKVCNASGGCYSSDIAAAIEYVVRGPDDTPKTGDEPARIMSISLGGGGTSRANCDIDYLARKVNWAVDNGVTVVAAAGNTSRRVSSPGCASKAIAVGAVDKNDVRASWSGTGSALDIMAPGVNIYSTIIDSYASWSGTSMATPHISATVALLKQVNSALTDTEIKDALYKTTKDLGATGWDRYYGWGRVDALVAVNYVKPLEPDADGDGVPDSKDACPSIAGTYCNGCPEPICSGCQGASCPATGGPICVDDDSVCTAPNAVGVCTAGGCSFTCNSGYDDCNSDMSDGCEVNLFADSNNCGFCSNVCGTITCPESGCGIGGCPAEEYGTYPAEQQTACIESVCSGECTATCEYNATCDPDDDNDGVSDTEDACPTTYGTDCNGCPNPCSGCAMMNCPVSGVPTCEAGISCPDTVCPADGCGVGTCADNEYGTYTTVSNVCNLKDNVGTCTENPCTLECIYNEACEVPTVKCWSGANQYLYRNNSQAKKFCRCVSGIYGYNSYSYSWGRQIVYKYVDTGDNEKWDVTSRYSYLPVYQVKCTDGVNYPTNQDYYSK